MHANLQILQELEGSQDGMQNVTKLSVSHLYETTSHLGWEVRGKSVNLSHFGNVWSVSDRRQKEAYIPTVL